MSLVATLVLQGIKTDVITEVETKFGITIKISNKESIFNFENN